MRRVVGGWAEKKLAASTNEMGRFETEFLPTEENLAALSSLCGAWVDRVHRRRALSQLVLDMDSSESPTYGNQEGSAHNGYFGCTCYHPLFCFNQFGDVEAAMLREGNVHSAHGWKAFVEPIVARYRGRRMKRPFRADAAFADPEAYRYLETKRFLYAIRLPANNILYEAIGHLWSRPVGRPSSEPKVFYHSFQYQAESWDKARRVVGKVGWHLGDLLPRVGFIVTNLTWWSRSVVEFYNKRGTAEQ